MSVNVSDAQVTGARAPRSTPASVGNEEFRFDGISLKKRMRRAERTQSLIAIGLLILPVAFLFFSIVVPITAILWSSIHSPVISRELPNLASATKQWDGKGQPPDAVVRAFVGDLLHAKRRNRVGRVVWRLNQEVAGFRSFLLETAIVVEREADRVGGNSLLSRSDLYAWMGRIDARWTERKYWVGLHQAAPAYTWVYLLRAFDRKYDLDGNIVKVPEDGALYVMVLGRTLMICAIVTVVSLILGFPVAYLLASLPMSKSNLLLLLLLLPLWTSMLVKTAAWLLVLGGEGVVNDLGRGLGLWTESIQLARTRTGAIISMVHILVPFMAFPIYGVMRNIDEYHMKAALIMGANPLYAFWRVYLPQTVSGIGAGIFLVFILSLGLYVPPAFVGGPSDQMLSYFIASNVNGGLAGALAVLLLAIVGIFMVAFQRIAGAGNLWFKAPT